MRVYLAVPYAEKDRAKSLGARWDPERRQWFVSDDMDLAAFMEWLPPAWRDCANRMRKRRRNSGRSAVAFIATIDTAIRNAARTNRSAGKASTGNIQGPCGGRHTKPPWEFEPCSAALGCHIEA